MCDKILIIKKEMGSICAMKNITRLERYNLIKEKYLRLTKTEQAILHSECKRDMASIELLDETRKFIETGFTVIGIIIALLAVIVNVTHTLPMSDWELFLAFSCLAVFYLLSIIIVENIKASRLKKAGFLLDTIENVNEEIRLNI